MYTQSRKNEYIYNVKLLNRDKGLYFRFCKLCLIDESKKDMLKLKKA